MTPDGESECDMNAQGVPLRIIPQNKGAVSKYEYESGNVLAAVAAAPFLFMFGTAAAFSLLLTSERYRRQRSTHLYENFYRQQINETLISGPLLDLFGVFGVCGLV